MLVSTNSRRLRAPSMFLGGAFFVGLDTKPAIRAASGMVSSVDFFPKYTADAASIP